MPSKEVVRNLVIYGTPEPPPIHTASNFDSIPLAGDLLRRSDGRPAQVIKIQTKIPKQEMLPNTGSAQTEKAPSIDIALVPFDPQISIEENERKMNRGMDRGTQYEKLLNLIADSEAALQEGTKYHVTMTNRDDEGILQSTHFEIDRDKLQKLKKIAETFSEGELEHEALTKELAEKIKARVGLQKDAVLEEADRIIVEAQRSKFTEIEITRTVIADETTTSEGSNVDKKDDAKKSEEKPKEEKKAKDEKKEVEFNEENVVAAVQYLVTIDRPSPDAARELQTIWERPF